MNLVFFPFHDYKLSLKEGFRTRDAHIYSKVIDNTSIHKTIIINRPTLLLEVVLKRKTANTSGEVIFTDGRLTVQKISEKLFVVDIIDFSVIRPILKGKAFISDLYFRNRKLIKKALTKLNSLEFTSYESSPLTRKTVEFLSPQKKIFDGVDNFCKHDSYASLKEELQAEYQSILKSYDKIYFNGRDSLSYFNCTNNERVEFMPNGVDFDRFQSEYKTPIIYKNSKLRKRKIAVYAGKMQSMFDVDLAAELAKSNPDVDFFYLGKILEGQPDIELQLYPNVIFTGDVHYEQLPAHITNADVCIIPYLVDKQHGGDPIKFYEYLASGNKIVSTCIGDIEKYHDNSSVYIVDKADFVDSFNSVIQSNTNKSIRSIPKHMTWQYKAERMFDLQEASN
ncbi:glycosyltransferase [Thalassotalea ganghwensis]